MTPRLVLASQSPSRRRLLEAVGLAFVTDAPRLDEEAVKESLRGEGATPEQAAETLAMLKAQKVSLRHPGALVVGSDQLLVKEAAWFDKPADLEAAARQLQALQGGAHRLVTSVVVTRDGERLWHHQEAPRITLRALDEAAIRRYLALAGPAVLSSVGAYQIEGPGALLMQRIEGDHFTVQGLPLLALLDFLRGHQVLPL